MTWTRSCGRSAAMALASHPLYRARQDPDTLDLSAHLVVAGAWWDYVDSPLAISGRLQLWVPSPTLGAWPTIRSTK